MPSEQLSCCTKWKTKTPISVGWRLSGKPAKSNRNTLAIYDVRCGERLISLGKCLAALRKSNVVQTTQTAARDGCVVANAEKWAPSSSATFAAAKAVPAAAYEGSNLLRETCSVRGARANLLEYSVQHYCQPGARNRQLLFHDWREPLDVRPVNLPVWVETRRTDDSTRFFGRDCGIEVRRRAPR